ncbi:uncharacterized protein LOC113501548 isoform X2 [Trichoplusia ni]|uniref:Uncharacterized protein LOC113501548 isoform X2 n=1 Tax=Trichoplusia ni TaxID=7111 RepID=A0A7E5WD04_TRINI|nr:uncharacterized protein LOC113501548 isoform X2 [Trichoplusia ni]
MAGVPTDWQLGCVEVKQRGAYLLQSGQWSDCTFLVGAEPHRVAIAGHKLVLAMASPVFEAMFYGGMAERNEPIPILDVQPEAFRALLEYIYTDNINISSFDKACELCYGAKKYMLPHLVKECTRYLWSDLYPRNACRAYEFARLFEENVLMDKCIQIISTNTKDVLNDSSFEDVELNTVITLFTLDHLNIDSELDLFEAAVRYAKAQDKRNQERSISPPSENGPPTEKKSKSPAPSTSKDKVVNVESSAENSPEAVTEPAKTSEPADQPQPGPSDESKKNKQDVKDKPTIRSAIEKIRFLTLTPQQFAEGPARSSLLTESEAFAVLMNILSSSSDVPMPSGFSTCRVPRKQLIGDGPSSNMATLTVDTPSPVMMEQVFGAPSQPSCLPHYPRPSRHDGLYNFYNRRPPLVARPARGPRGGRGGAGAGRRLHQDLLPAPHHPAHRLPQHLRPGLLRHLHGRQEHLPARRAGPDAGPVRGVGAGRGRQLLRAAVRAPAGRGRGAPHLHALHQPRALPPSARHHVQPPRLHTAEQGLQSGHRIQQGRLVPDGHLRAAGSRGVRFLQFLHRTEQRLRPRRSHTFHHLHLLATNFPRSHRHRPVTDFVRSRRVNRLGVN